MIAPMHRPLAIAASALAAFVGCEPLYTPDTQPELIAAVRDPVVEAGATLPVDVEVKNFDLQPATAELPFRASQGHLHVLLDDGADARELRLTVVNGQRVLIPLEIADGSHRLRFVLHHNDHGPVDGVADAHFDVEVRAPALTFVVQRLLGEQFVPGGDAEAELTVGGFALDPARYEVEDVLRHGHYHVLFSDDEGAPTDLGAFFDGRPRFAIPQNALLGKRDLIFRLHGNLHGPLDPPVDVAVPVEIVAQ